MGSLDQIQVIQAGSELFAFDTITWPGEVFQHPIVYQAVAFDEGDYPDHCKTWKYIQRSQYEWLVRHYGCMVSYVGADINDGHTFYCNNHHCWEKEGKDHFIVEPEPEYYIDPDLEEERNV